MQHRLLAVAALMTVVAARRDNPVALRTAIAGPALAYRVYSGWVSAEYMLQGGLGAALSGR